jgi:hypothetical protein
MQIRRALPHDLAGVGEVTVAAYAEFAHADTGDYVDDYETRPRAPARRSCGWPLVTTPTKSWAA